MNADKTDISNINRPRNQTPGTTLPEKKSKEIQSAGDLTAKKQISAEKATKDQRYQRNHKISE